MHSLFLTLTLLTTIITVNGDELVPASSSSISLKDSGHGQYLSNISIEGTTLPVVLTTGSSEFWVQFPGRSVPSNLAGGQGDSDIFDFTYGKGRGRIRTGHVQLGDISVDNLSFWQADSTSASEFSIENQVFDGILGFGLDTAGDAFCGRVLEILGPANRYISLFLGRKQESRSSFTDLVPVPWGESKMVFGGVLSEFEKVLQMPKLNVHRIAGTKTPTWLVLTDPHNGIVGPDGEAVVQDSVVPLAPKDTPFSIVPRHVADAIYGRIQHSHFDPVEKAWILPCRQYVNITFSFGGVTYPIHPQDVVDHLPPWHRYGRQKCIGTFKPTTSPLSEKGYDLLLGANFLRNVYSVLNYGGSSDAGKTDPFVQFLPITDPFSSMVDFAKIRLQLENVLHFDTDRYWRLLPKERARKAPLSEEETEQLRVETSRRSARGASVSLSALVAFSVIGWWIWKKTKRWLAIRRLGWNSLRNVWV